MKSDFFRSSIIKTKNILKISFEFILYFFRELIYNNLISYIK